MAPGERWCSHCGEAVPAGQAACGRCGSRRLAEVGRVLRADEYYEVTC